MYKYTFLLLAATILIITSCTSPDYNFELSETEVEEQLSKNFPFNKNLFIATIHLDAPKVNFKKESIVVNLDYKGTILADTITGTIKVSGGLRYNKEHGAFYLKNTTIQELIINEIDANETTNIKSTMEKVALPYLEDFPVYVLQDDQVKQSILKLSLKKVKMKEGKLELVLGI